LANSTQIWEIWVVEVFYIGENNFEPREKHYLGSITLPLNENPLTGINGKLAEFRNTHLKDTKAEHLSVEAEECYSASKLTYKYYLG
jgi:hypothetical protein